ncbi:MAG: SDR family oxidoreductase [Acidobacteria bacterium]|nr:SDR family oxidoreductase [Acidobacteriota bacterium]MSO63282.1 SDR family oxidoreductase [Acidobacteriota bacterium]
MNGFDRNEMPGSRVGGATHNGQMQIQRFLVTGGSQGIGAAVVTQARQAGHQVVFTGRNDAQLEALATVTGAHGVKADVSIDADNARTVATCTSVMGGIDVLINNAGTGYAAEIGALEIDKMRQLFGINVFGMVDLTNRVVPLMKAQAGGDIVNLASTSGMKGAKGGTAYAASKWAVRGMSQCWQAELRPHGIRVVCICPSEVQTNWMGRTGRNNPNKLYAEDIAATIMAGLNLPRRVLWPEVAVFANNPWKED